MAKSSGYKNGPGDEPVDMDSYIELADRWSPKARDVPDLRKRLAEDWLPDGAFSLLAPQMRTLTEGKHDWVPEWEHTTAKVAQLWYVGPDMVDLLMAAAPSIPPTALDETLLPDEDGLVVFGKPFLGIDSAGDEVPVRVGGYVWGTALIEGAPGIGISAYSSLEPGQLLPIGSLSWLFGLTADEFRHSGRPEWVKAQESMAEDRRVLQALWLLSSQPGVAQVRTETANRQTSRRMQRSGYQQSDVRIITLRQQHHETDEAAPSREYQHRWLVNGHWRNQPYGPGRSQTRPVFIHPYLKGPEDAPLLQKETVKSWTR